MRSRRLAIAALAGMAAAGTLLSVVVVTAQVPQPSPPSFAYLYGRVLLAGENVSPQEQPVIAFVNGRSCGGAPSQTFVALPGADVPDDDVGRTVYVIDVLADGTANYERRGCGHAGEPVILYFPVIGRIGAQQPLFQPGPIRNDLDLDIDLGKRLVLPSVTSEGVE